MPEYATTRAGQALHQDQINGSQPGDPEKAVAALITVAEEENPPLHLLLGIDALEITTQKLAALREEFN